MNSADFSLTVESISMKKTGMRKNLNRLTARINFVGRMYKHWLPKIKPGQEMFTMKEKKKIRVGREFEGPGKHEGSSRILNQNNLNKKG